MQSPNRQVVTILLGLIAYIEAQICDLDCGHGYTCVIRRSTCFYPPCPSFPTCSAVTPRDALRALIRQSGRELTSVQRNQTESNSLQSNGGTQLSGGPESVRPGQCPSSTISGPCINTCRLDTDCPESQKCCENDCGRTCRPATNGTSVQKPGTCARHLERVSGSCHSNCVSDADCPGVQKCCSTSCSSVCSDPCYYWLGRTRRSTRNMFIWKIPFMCRI